MHSRINTEAYAKGAAVLDNVVQLPQGGIKRRGGLEYVDELPVEARLIPFAFSTTQSYLLAFYVDGGVEKMNVYKDGALITNINGSGNDFLAISTTITQAQMLALNWTQSANTLFLVHEDIAPFSIVRGGTDATWTEATLSLKNTPQFDYNDASSPTPTTDVQDITFAGTANGERYRLSLEDVVTEDITWSGIAADNRSRIEDAIRALPNVFPRSDVTVTSTSLQQYVINFAGGAAKDWEDIQVTDPYGDGITMVHTPAGETTGSPRSEDVWSATRGWPRTVTIYEGRFWFGGSKSRPQSLWGTAIGEFSTTMLDFDTGLAYDDDGIDITLDTDQVNAITALHPGRHLQVFTTGGEFAVIARPITPSNIAVINQSRFGSMGLRPLAIDGAVLFIQRTGRALREYLFSDVEQAYTANSLSLLASHLLITPVDADALVGTTDDDANYLYIINTDGTVAVFNTLRDQEVAGWTRFTTAGNFLRVGVDDQTTYFLVERTINTVTKYYLEKYNNDAYMDSSKIYGASGPSFTGLSHLEAETVRVKADGSVLGSEVVASGAITADRASATDAEVGLNFDTIITTLPINLDAKAGDTFMRKNRIVRTTLHLHESQGVLVDGSRLPDRTFGADVLDDPPASFTGIKEIRNLGWSRLKQVSITQVDPVPLTLLGAEFTIKVNH